MRLVTAALLLSLGACADAPAEGPSSPTPPADAPSPADDFDAQAWLAEARAVRAAIEGEGSEMEMSGEAADRARRLARDLAEAADWPRACDTIVDPETGETSYEPTPQDGTPIYYGMFEIGEVSETEAVVSLICSFGAYQGTYALVHVDGDRADVVRAPAVGMDGRPMEVADGAFATPDWADIAEGSFTTLALARGIGDCGRLTRYDLVAPDSAAVREVRERDCGEVPDDLPPPDDWPLLYPAD